MSLLPWAVLPLRAVRSLVLLMLVILAPHLAVAQEPAGKWSAALLPGGGRTLTYQPAAGTGRFEIGFFCDTAYTPSERGAMGFNLRVNAASTIKGFSFVDFEGPDAPAQAKKLLTARVNRKGAPALVLPLRASGSFVDADAFSFSVAEVTRVASSDPKSLLKALAAADAESLQITVTDFRNPKSTLVFTIPVAARQPGFNVLLTGVK